MTTPSFTTRRAANLRWSGLAAAVIALVVFWRTAYPTITWWDSSEYSAAAGTLGIISAPGSLLLTLIGWPIAHLPLGSSPAHLLNLFGGLLAGVCVMLVSVVSLRLLRVAGRTNPTSRDDASLTIGAALGALTFAFSGTLWEYGTKFSPYILTPVVTGLLLWTLTRWWDEADTPDGWRWLIWFALLIGLDFSVHRTNALIVPGAIVWILIRKPTALIDPRVVVGALGGLAAGLAVQLLTIPITRFSHSPVTFWDPGTLSRFWGYVSLEGRGGGFLIELFPRKSNPWSVQTLDLLHTLRNDFLGWNGGAQLIGVLPAAAAIYGLVVLGRSNRRLGIAYGSLVVLQAVTTVLYFNIPANYFRTFERHYLPVCLSIAVLAAVGGASAVAWSVEQLGQGRRVTAIIAAAAVFAPLAQLTGNWHARDASNRWMAHDFAVNLLEPLPKDAILFTVGDNDTFPLYYMQAVEGLRPDVTIINQSVANIEGYAERLKRRESSVPIAASAEERRTIVQQSWTDTLLTVPVLGTRAQLGLTAKDSVPRAVTFVVQPGGEGWALPANVTLVDIVRTNQFKRPLTFAVTGGESALGWLGGYARLEGLYSRILPGKNPRIDADRVRANLLHGAYRGLADSSVIIDPFGRNMAGAYYSSLSELLKADKSRGDMAACRADRDAFFALMPPARLQLESFVKEIGATCD